MKRLESNPREEGILLRNLKTFEGLCATMVAMVEVRVAGTDVAESPEYKGALKSAGLFVTDQEEVQHVGLARGLLASLVSLFVGPRTVSPLDGWENTVKSQVDEIQVNTPIQRLFKTAGFEPAIYICEESNLIYAIPDYEDALAKTGIDVIHRRR